MKQVNLRSTVHNFDKQNLVTQKTGGRMHDVLRCKRCGIQGKRYGLDEYIMVPTNTSDKKIMHCDGKSEDNFLGKTIRIDNCHANGKQFSNLTKGSYHQIVKPPTGYVNGDRGVWVQGVGEPVKLLFDEFDIKEKPAEPEHKSEWDWFYE